MQAGYFNRVGALFAGFYVELNPVAFLDFVNEAGLMDENFFLGIVGYDEAKTLGIIEKLNSAGKHKRVGIK